MTDERITAYLLGELPGEESERFEEECFAGEDWPAEISLAEDDLIDNYLRGELTTEQRRHFEQSYLVTEERRRRVAIAAGLLRHIDKLGNEGAAVPAHTPSGASWASILVAFWSGRSWALRAGLAVGLVAAVAVTVWVLRPRTNSPHSIATLTLTISADTRAEGTRPGRVKLPPDADALRINLKLPARPANVARYRVELVDEDGGSESTAATVQDAATISVEFPASRLPAGQYALRLFTIRPDNTEERISGLYYFIVEN